MNCKFSSILKIMILFIFILFLLLPYIAVYADGSDNGPYKVLENFDGNDQGTIDSNSKSAIKKIIGMVLDVTRRVGIGIAIFILLYISWKIMTAAPSEKANIKNYSINYAIGAAVLFGAAGILGFSRDFIISLFD